VSWIKIQSILFKPKFVLTLSVKDLLPIFEMIHFICLNNVKTFFILQILETVFRGIYMPIAFHFQQNGKFLNVIILSQLLTIMVLLL